MKNISSFPISTTLSPSPQTSVNDAESVSSGLVYNVNDKDSSAETVTNLAGRARRNAVSKQEAAHSLAQRNLSPGTPIKSTTTLPQSPPSINQPITSTASRGPIGATAYSPQAGRPKLSKEERSETKEKLYQFARLFDKATGRNQSKDSNAGRDMSTYTLFFDKEIFGDKSYMRIEKDMPENSGARLRYLKTGGTARELAGQKLLGLFQKAGLTITDEIRQALPGKESLGNAKVIEIAVETAIGNIANEETVEKIRLPATQDQVLQATKDELSARKPVNDANGKPIPGKTTPVIDWDTGDGIGTLLRENSAASKKLGGHLGDVFKDAAAACTRTATVAAYDSLQKTGSPDKAMAAAYTALLHSLKDVEFSDDFQALASELTKLVNDTAGKNNQHTNAAKSKIIMNLMLRTLIPELTDQLRQASGFFENAATQCLKPGEHLPKSVSMRNLAQRLQELFNETTDTKKTRDNFAKIATSLPDYAALLKDAKLNNLSQFASFNTLRLKALG